MFFLFEKVSSSLDNKATNTEVRVEGKKSSGMMMSSDQRLAVTVKVTECPRGRGVTLRDGEPLVQRARGHAQRLGCSDWGYEGESMAR